MIARSCCSPGSVLFSREEPKKRRLDEPGRPAPRKDNKVPRWIMASEIVETTRVYARTCALASIRSGRSISARTSCA